MIRIFHCLGYITAKFHACITIWKIAKNFHSYLLRYSKTVGAAIVGSWLDFCNSILAGTSVSNLARLQRVQNTLARVVAQKKPRFCHITPVLSDLHWHFSHPILLLSSHDMYRREHSALLHLCQYVFPHVKPAWHPPNHSHLLLRVSGMHCRIICRSSQLSLVLEELSNITYSCLLALTVVQNVVWSNQLNVSHFVIHRQLLPSQNHLSSIAELFVVNTMPPLIAFHLSAYD